MVERTEQIVREAPDIEAYKLGLMQDALSLAQTPVGVQQYDAEGNVIMEDYQFRDADGNIQTGQRPSLKLPEQQIAGMSPLQQQALAQAAQGIGGFEPYMTGATNTLGQAQLATTGALAAAQPYQTRAAGYLDTAGQGVGTQVSGAQQGITNALSRGLTDTGAAQAGISSALALGLTDTRAAQAALGAAKEQAGSVAMDLGTRGRGIVGQLGTDLGGTTAATRGLADTAAGQLDFTSGRQRALAQAGDRRLIDATMGGLQSYEQALSGVQDVDRAAQDVQRQAQLGTLLSRQRALGESADATTRGRAITAGAAQDLARAGRFGMGTAARGIENLFGSTGEFDPAATSRFMNPFEQQVVDQTLADIARQGDIQREQQRAQAVAAGAFGGARSGIMESELGRNILEQQAKAASQLRRAGFESSAQRAQQAFEAQQARQQQAAQLTGALGASGSQAAARAAQAAGGLGLSAEQLAAQQATQQGQLDLTGEQLMARTGLQAQQLRQSGALSGGQLGLAAQQQAARNIAQGTQFAMSAEQQAAANAAKAAQLGMTAEQFASANAQSLASTGLSLEQAAAQTGMQAADLAGRMAQTSGQLGQSMAQMGMQGAETAGRLGQSMSQMGVQGAQASGQLGLQGVGMQADIGKGIAALGSDVARLGLEGGKQLGTLGLQQASLGELGQNLAQREQGFLFDLGKAEQAQNQAVLEANRQNQLAQIYEPYQRLGFVSDIYKGAPTSQMSITSQASPNVSPAQTFLGLGVAGLSAAAGAKNVGLFG